MSQPLQTESMQKKLPNFSLFTEKDFIRLKNGNLFT